MKISFQPKVLIARSVISFLCCFTLTSMVCPETCDTAVYNNLCLSHLGDFNYLKTYPINGQGREKVEYSYVFTRGTQYMLNLCSSDESTEGIVITLFDSDRNRVASSNVNGQRVSSMVYLCGATGIYYIQYTFEGGATCAASTLGFKH